MGKKRKISRKLCRLCGKSISAARLEALPDTDLCVECSAKNPKPFDPRTVDISESSPIDRTGFARSD